MPDAIDAVDPDNIGAEWDGLPVIRATVLADDTAQLFDSEAGNIGVDAVARAMLRRQMAGRWSVGYTNGDSCPTLTRAMAAIELRWLDATLWPQPGPYLHAAAPGQPPGTVPAWCPVNPVAVQDRWVGGLYDLSTVYGKYPARVLGYIDGRRSIWPAPAWQRFRLIPDSGPPPPPPPPPPTGVLTVPPCVFTTDFDRNQQVFYVDSSGQVIHHWWDHTSKKWSGAQPLGAGWKPDGQLVAAQDSDGTFQVWGDLAAGGVGQVYWSGKAWVPQHL